MIPEKNKTHNQKVKTKDEPTQKSRLQKEHTASYIQPVNISNQTSLWTQRGAESEARSAL